jgi:hypothetical protein
VPEPGQVVDGLGRDGVVVDEDVRLVAQPAAGHDDVGADVVEPLDLALEHRQRHQDDRVDLAARGQVLEEVAALGLVAHLVEQGVAPGLTQVVLDGREHRCVEPSAQVGHDDGDPPGAAAREAGGLGGDDVGELGRDLADAVARGLADPRDVAQGARHRRDGDAGLPRDVGHVDVSWQETWLRIQGHESDDNHLVNVCVRGVDGLV